MLVLQRGRWPVAADELHVRALDDGAALSTHEWVTDQGIVAAARSRSRSALRTRARLRLAPRRAEARRRSVELLIRRRSTGRNARGVHDGLAREHKSREVEVRHPTSVGKGRHGDHHGSAERGRASSKRAKSEHRLAPA